VNVRFDLCVRTAVAAALLAAACSAARVEVDLAIESSIESRLKSGAVKPKERQATIQGLFAEVGCSVEVQRVDRHAGNVICTLPGQTSATIVVGGHFDFIDRGKGIVDDWSGTSLLPSLYQALKGRPHQHTYVFVAFAAEETGLFGSSRYVKTLTEEQKANIRAVVNLECLGLGPPEVWTHRAAPALVTYLNAIANAIGMTVQGVDVDKVGDDDTHPFLSAHIPVITIHFITQDTLRILHSERDRMEAIHFDDYYATYKLVSYYLAYLDVKTKP
jgi:putative aminopeptidase FrvX